MQGRNGFDVHNPNSRYQVRGLEASFSGLAITCYLYAAMQAIAPGTNIGMDLSHRSMRWPGRCSAAPNGEAKLCLAAIPPATPAAEALCGNVLLYLPLRHALNCRRWSRNFSTKPSTISSITEYTLGTWTG